MNETDERISAFNQDLASLLKRYDASRDVVDYRVWIDTVAKEILSLIEKHQMIVTFTPPD